MFEFGIKDIIDIVLVALMLYYIYRLMKESRSLNVFIGIMVFIVVWLFGVPDTGDEGSLEVSWTNWSVWE